MEEIKKNNIDHNSLEKKHLKCSFEIKNINNDDPNFFIFEGYASTFGNIDLGDDIVERGAFKESLVSTPEIKILWQHDMSKPIGKSLLMREDDKGLFLKAQISKRTTLGSDAAALVEDGVIDSMSIGFIIKDYDIKEGIRHIKQLDLFETSLVTLPMNPQAKLTGFKAVNPDKNIPIASRDRDWDSDAAVARIRDFTNSEDKPSADYKKYFMFYDADNSDLFSAYKLPFADIIDGEPHIIPKAIFAIAGVLSGGRGGVDIPQSDKERITSIINGCYKRMAEEFDDESLVSPLEKSKSEDINFEYKSVDEVPAEIKAIEKFLKFKGLSSNESKAIISRIKDTMKQREVADQRVVREEQTSALISELKNLTNYLKGNK